MGRYQRFWRMVSKIAFCRHHYQPALWKNGRMDLPKFEQAAKLYPLLSWVLMFQTTKDGKFLGKKNWQHAVDVEIYCDNGKAKEINLLNKLAKKHNYKIT